MERLTRGKQAFQGIHLFTIYLHYSFKAVFVNTDALPVHNSRVGDLMQNTTGRRKGLYTSSRHTEWRAGHKDDLLCKLLQHFLPERVKNGLEILAADQSQDRDSERTIAGLVCPNEAGQVSGLCLILVLWLLMTCIPQLSRSVTSSKIREESTFLSCVRGANLSSSDP